MLLLFFVVFAALPAMNIATVDADVEPWTQQLGFRDQLLKHLQMIINSKPEAERFFNLRSKKCDVYDFGVSIGQRGETFGLNPLQLSALTMIRHGTSFTATCNGVVKEYTCRCSGNIADRSGWAYNCATGEEFLSDPRMNRYGPMEYDVRRQLCYFPRVPTFLVPQKCEMSQINVMGLEVYRSLEPVARVNPGTQLFLICKLDGKIYQAQCGCSGKITDGKGLPIICPADYWTKTKPVVDQTFEYRIESGICMSPYRNMTIRRAYRQLLQSYNNAYVHQTSLE